jgi:hypothetical protein
LPGSILDDTKKLLGLDPSYAAFDLDIMMHINTVFTGLSALGIGPAGGFMITDNTATWDSYIGTDLDLNSVKTYIAMRVRMIFDPPPIAAVIEANKAEIEKLEVLLSIKREGESWVDPNPPADPVSTEPPWWEVF